jgi:GntR family transcriptional regulator
LTASQTLMYLFTYGHRKMVQLVITFRLQSSSGVPTYLQLVQQVEDALRVGQLRVGDQLPKLREVVADLAINPNTVLKAYRELEGKGLLEGRPGQGTFVTAALGEVPFSTHTTLRRSLAKWVSSAREAGLDDAAIGSLFSTTLHDTRSEGVA